MSTIYAKKLTFLSIIFAVLHWGCVVEAAPLKPSVVEELSSDLAKIDKLLSGPSSFITPEGSSSGSVRYRDSYKILEKVRVKEINSPTIFVAGKMDDLKPKFRTILGAKGVKRGTMIGSLAGAFQSDKIVYPKGFKVLDRIQSFKYKGNFIPWTVVSIPQAAKRIISGKIKATLKRIEDMRKKYEGKGIKISGFSISIPVVSITINFDFE